MTTFIAEISSNHNQDLERCKAIVKACSDGGFSAVKFQLFRVEDLFAPEILTLSEPHRKRKEWELPEEFLPELAEYSRELGLNFAATPFSLVAVEKLRPFVDFYKVASYELIWDELLIQIAQTGKPVVISTGMATLSEVRHAVATLTEAGALDIGVLHCVSAYPTPIEEANLAAIQTLRRTTGRKVGWSDHTNRAAVIHRAIHRWGAEIIEMHVDLDAQGYEYGPGHCWLVNEASRVIHEVREAQLADGTGKKAPSAGEIQDREWRADPSDGLRPLRHVRTEWLERSDFD